MSPAAYLDHHAADLTGLVRRIVNFPTVNPPGVDYEGVTALLTRELRALGLQARRLPISTALMRKHLPPEQRGFPRYNVLGRLAVRGAKKTIHFNAHYDVVPVSGQWKHGSPFSGKVDGGWIYGRGTADMKGSHASLLMALRALRATGTAPKLNVEVSFTADEETDSALGAGWLVEHAPIRPDYAIVMEGGEAGHVCCGHNGVVWLEVTVHGRAAHGSTPGAGVNALEKMSALVLLLGDYSRRLSRRTFTTPEGKVMHPTLNLGGVFGAGEGGKINTVPSLARFSIDRRVIAIETVAAAERETRAVLAAAARRIPGCRITVAKVGQSSLLSRAKAPVLRRHGAQRHPRAPRPDHVQRLDGLQRHAFLLAPPQDPDARLRPRRRQRARDRRARPREGPGQHRQDLRRPAGDVWWVKCLA